MVDADAQIEDAAVTSASNAYSAALGIRVPRVEDAMSSADANYYSLLVVALLERGAPMTLDEVAVRFEEAGVASARDALASLKRCKPARAPVYRDGDHYALIAALEEAWRQRIPMAWSAQRVAVAVLDAHDAAMTPDDVLAFVATRSQWSPLRAESAQFWRVGAAVRVLDDGRWMLDRAHGAVRSAREAVRDRVRNVRRWAEARPDPAAMEAHRQRIEREREAHARQLAKIRRVLVLAFPAARPEAVSLVDVGERTIQTFVADEVARVGDRLATYEIIGAIGSGRSFAR
jgi:hypothetical protein